MRRFRFPLAAVLRVSTTRVRLAQRELALAVGRRDQALGVLRQTEEAYRATALELIQLETGRIKPEQVVATRRYLDRLVEEVALRQGRLKEAEEGVKVARLRLVEQRQSEQTLEDLRRHRWRQHQYEAGREEQSELDSVGTQGFLRRSRDQGRAS